MGKQLYTGRQVNLGMGASGSTGLPWYVGDFASVTVSVETGSAVASRTTIMGSNLDGFQSTLSSGGGLGDTTNNGSGGWSNVIVITVPGVSSLTITGIRWLNALRPILASGQTASNTTVIFAGTT